MHSTRQSLVALSLFTLLAPAASFALSGDGQTQAPRRFGDAAEASAFKSEVGAGRLGAGSPAAPAPEAANPALALQSDSVRLTLDAFGSFGSSTAGQDADFDDGNREAGTVFEYMVHARGLGFLDGDALLLPQDWAQVERDGETAVSVYDLGAFHFELRSRLSDCEQAHCAWLEQEWTVTNRSSVDAELELTPYLDGDLFFSGDFGNDYGARSGDTLYQFDSGSDPAAPSTYLGLKTSAPGALRVVREVGEYSELRRRLKNGELLVERLARADHSSADADGDGVTDTGFDVSLAVSHDFGLLAPGAAATLTVRLQWGLGALDDLEEPVQLLADAGADQLRECEGRDGTLVVLDGSASGPADLLVAHRWLLDGLLVAEGPVAELLLPRGDHEFVLEIEDAAGRVAADSMQVRIADTERPIAEVGAALTLWPPNHQLVEVVPPVRLFDACSDSISLRYVAVLVDEAAEVAQGGDGSTDEDVVLTEDGRLLLRAERQGGGDGRVYKVVCRASDDSGNGEVFAFEVQVPQSARQAAVASEIASVVRFH